MGAGPEAAVALQGPLELRHGVEVELKRALQSDGGLRAGAHARQISSGGAP